MAKTKPVAADDFTPDAYMIRTTDKNGRSYNDFEWPREIGAIVACPDWSPEPRCGHGLHGLLDGIGDWSLLGDDSLRLWWVVGVLRAEAVAIDDDKVKVPRGRVEFFGDFPGAMKRITQHLVPRVLALAEGNTATGNRSPAWTTGYASPAATTGNASPAATTGYASPAAATGKNSIAAALGINGTAKAAAGGAIVLAAYDDDFNLVAVRASLVGQNGVEPGIAYRLTAAGEFEAA